MIVLLPVDELLHTQSQHLNVERFGQIVVGTQLQSFYAADVGGACCQQNYRDVRQSDISLHPAAELKTIDARHHHVADDEVYPLALQYVECSSSVGGCVYLIILLHTAADERKHVLIVVDDKNGGQRIMGTDPM